MPSMLLLPGVPVPFPTPVHTTSASSYLATIKPYWTYGLKCGTANPTQFGILSFVLRQVCASALPLLYSSIRQSQIDVGALCAGWQEAYQQYKEYLYYPPNAAGFSRRTFSINSARSISLISENLRGLLVGLVERLPSSAR